MNDKATSIKTNTAILMVAVALAIDSLQGLLTVTWVGVVFNPIIGALAGFLFNSWFLSFGVRLLSKNNMPIFVGTFIAELVPFLDSLPLWTGSVIITLIRNRV